MILEVLKHAEIGIVENPVENMSPVVLRVGIEKRLYRDAVREHKDDSHHCEVEQFNYL